jgi:carbonic anhydrase/acetyltransferase-like protein (isoleucine patch superfamily)
MVGNDSFVRIGKCLIDPSAQVSHGAVVGKQYRPLVGFPKYAVEEQTVIRRNAFIGHYTVIGAGTIIDEGAVIDDSNVIECEVYIGKSTLVTYQSQVCNEARIGINCVIGGFVGERVVVGDRSRVFGKIVHSQHNPSLPWDAPDSEEKSAEIESDVFIGFGAIVVGEVRVGRGSYVCPGAIVTKNVPSGYVVHGVNLFVPFSDWPGSLRDSPFFQAHESPPQASGTKMYRGKLH